jgi:uncharacterized protein
MNPGSSIRMKVWPEVFAVCRLPRDQAIPSWALQGSFYSITRTQDELSIVCLQTDVPQGVTCENGWRALQVEGVLDFSLVGILYTILQPLTQAGISIFAISTYDTDYLLVKEQDLENAASALSQSGISVT